MTRVQITLGMFNAVKIMLKGGATGEEINSYLGVSPSSVSRIKNSDSYEEYKQKASMAYLAYHKKEEKQEPKEEPKVEEKPAQVIEHRQTVTVQATHYMMEEMKKTNELLTLISKKLCAIIDDLYGTGEKKDA